MKAILKILLGTIFVIGGIYWYFVNLSLGTGLLNWQAFVLLFKGFFGFFVFLLGLFMVWLEADELKVKKDAKETVHAKPKLTQTEEIKAAVGKSQKSNTVCAICGKEFKSERGLKIHQARAH